MKLLLAEPRGFCAGVVRAIETVEQALHLWGAPIYIKHEIVHNRHVVERLKAKGAVFIEDLIQVPAGSRLIYSAHGVAPQVREEAKRRKLIEIDATCGLVTKVHSAAKRYAMLGYHVILIGHQSHVEIIGTQGEAPNQTTVVETVADVDRLNFPVDTPLAYLTQTTLSLHDVVEITEALKQKYPHIETLPSSSICYATTNRQLALRAMAVHTQLVLVVGDRMSSNSNRLVEVAMQAGICAHLINGPGDIEAAWLIGVDVLGLTAGASTPEDVVQACIEQLLCLGVTTIESFVHTQENVVFQLPRELTRRMPS